MSEVGTQLDGGYLPPEARAAATRYLERTGNADVLVVLGLVDDPEAKRRRPKGFTAGVGMCSICGNRLPGHGVCRKSKACREAAQAPTEAPTEAPTAEPAHPPVVPVVRGYSGRGRGKHCQACDGWHVEPIACGPR